MAVVFVPVGLLLEKPVELFGNPRLEGSRVAHRCAGPKVELGQEVVDGLTDRAEHLLPARAPPVVVRLVECGQANPVVLATCGGQPETKSTRARRMSGV